MKAAENFRSLILSTAARPSRHRALVSFGDSFTIKSIKPDTPAAVAPGERSSVGMIKSEIAAIVSIS